MEDVVVAKPDDPVAWLLETLQSSGKPLGDVEVKRRLNDVIGSTERTLTIAKHFPQYRRQIAAALDKSDGTIGAFMVTAKEALAGKAGPTSV